MCDRAWRRLYERRDVANQGRDAMANITWRKDSRNSRGEKSFKGTLKVPTPSHFQPNRTETGTHHHRQKRTNRKADVKPLEEMCTFDVRLPTRCQQLTTDGAETPLTGKGSGTASGNHTAKDSRQEENPKSESKNQIMDASTSSRMLYQNTIQ